VIEVNADRQRPHLTEHGVVFRALDGRTDGLTQGPRRDVVSGLTDADFDVPAYQPLDLTPLADLSHGQSRAGPVRERRPVYVDLLPPCNAGCPAGENIPGLPMPLRAGAVSVPVIGSLNGITPGSWARYARSMQDSGAAAIELNIYYLPGDPHICGRDVEQRHLDILARVKDSVTVPVAVKLSPYFSATGEMARRLDEAGADGLALFNRLLQPDIDPETLSVVRAVSLSTPAEIRLPLRWIALLRGRVGASLAATTGVESAAGLIKYLLAGADVVMTASALLRHGPDHATVLLDGLCEWMRRKGYTTVEELRGLLATPVGADETTRERWDYVSALREANSTDYGPW